MCLISHKNATFNNESLKHSKLIYCFILLRRILIINFGRNQNVIWSILLDSIFHSVVTLLVYKIIIVYKMYIYNYLNILNNKFQLEKWFLIKFNTIHLLKLFCHSFIIINIQQICFIKFII